VLAVLPRIADLTVVEAPRKHCILHDPIATAWELAGIATGIIIHLILVITLFS
jgi:hypothetical protein